MLAKVCSASDMVEQVIVAPGNGGMSKEFDAFPLQVEDNDAIVALARRQEIDLVVVGPEVPLCNGAVDSLEAANIPAYGPKKAGAELEGSKAFTKDFLNRHGIPTASYGNFSDADGVIEVEFFETYDDFPGETDGTWTGGEIYLVHDGEGGGGTGACCIDAQCVIFTSEECDLFEGEYLGDDVPCDDWHVLCAPLV